MAIAAVAAGAVVAGTVASTVAAATAAPGGTAGSFGTEREPWEKILTRGTADLLEQDSRVTQDALAAGHYLNDEQYATMGLKPIYAEGSPDLGAMNQRANALREERAAAQTRKVDIKREIQDLKREQKKAGPGGKAQFEGERKALRKEQRELERNSGRLRREESLADRELGDAQALPRQITGFEKIKPVDPTGDESYTRAFELENQGLEAALRGEKPTDPTLLRSIDEGEAQLREQLRRSLGPDYAASSAGADALTEFGKRKNEALATYNRELIGQYSGLTESRAASLSDLRGSRMEQLAFVPNQQIARASALGESANRRIPLLGVQGRERDRALAAQGMQYDADVAESQADAAKTSAIVGSVGTGLTKIGGAIGGAA